MAKEEKYVVACVKNYYGSTGEQGTVLGEFRQIEFARRARSQMAEEARKKGWSGVRGIFLNKKFIELL